MLESPFNRLASFKTFDFLKKRLQHRCFPMNIAKFLGTVFLWKSANNCFCNSCFLLLIFLLKGLFLLWIQWPRFNKFSFLRCIGLSFSLIWKREKLGEIGHSLSFVVTLCTIRFHSLSLVVIRCHSLSLVVFRCTTRLSFYKRSKWGQFLFKW